MPAANDMRFEKLSAIARLMRLANVFTAIADVWMGLIVANGGLYPWSVAIGLTACSCLLYTAGMVLNDVFDAKTDAVERPERPIPSGRISLNWAIVTGFSLLVMGLAAGILVSLILHSIVPGLIAWLLALTIVAYDGWLKKTWLGPFAMAFCRTGNVLLGMSPAILHFGSLDFVQLGVPTTLAWGIGCYVLGITWFARHEHQQSPRRTLILGTVIVALGIAMIARGAWNELGFRPTYLQPWQWLALWAAVAVSILTRFLAAIRSPTPRYVQRAVAHAILSLILIDSVICLGYAGPLWAGLVLGLLVPAMLLSRWLHVT